MLLVQGNWEKTWIENRLGVEVVQRGKTVVPIGCPVALCLSIVCNRKVVSHTQAGESLRKMVGCACP